MRPPTAMFLVVHTGCPQGCAGPGHLWRPRRDREAGPPSGCFEQVPGDRALLLPSLAPTLCLHFLCSLRPVSSQFVSPMRVSPVRASTLVHRGVPGAPSPQVLSPARGNGCLSAPHSSPCSPSPAPELHLQRLSSPPHLYAGLSPGGTTVPWP